MSLASIMLQAVVKAFEVSVCKKMCSACRQIQMCARCRFRKMKNCWIKKYGTVHCASGNETATWIAERRRAWPGPWAIGCVLCCNFVKHCEALRINLPESKRGKTEWGTNFARFEVRSLSVMQPRNLVLHARSNMHQEDLRFFASPAMAHPAPAAAPGSSKACPFWPRCAAA